MIIVLVLHCQYCELQISLIQLSAYFGAESLNCTQLGDDVNNLREWMQTKGFYGRIWCKLCKYLKFTGSSIQEKVAGCIQLR